MTRFTSRLPALGMVWLFGTTGLGCQPDLPPSETPQAVSPYPESTPTPTAAPTATQVPATPAPTEAPATPTASATPSGPTPTEAPPTPTTSAPSPTEAPATPTASVPTPTEAPPTPTPQPEDVDGDGFSVAEGDCNDLDDSRYPGAEEVPYDGIDQDCDFIDLVDVDEDTFAAVEAGGTDCNDQSASIYPGAAEIPYDDIDQDCLSGDWVDQDGDGVSGIPAGGLDCDDTDANTYPGALEFADGEDNDCDGQIDEDLNTTDDDRDGFSEAQGDCNDYDSTSYPGALEVPYDGIDQDCSGLDWVDVDEDGQPGSEAGGADCEDTDPSIYTGAVEIPYDGIDQDCLSGDLTDVDQDGVSSTQVPGGTDCQDRDPSIHPGLTDIPYDGVDQDCSGADTIDVDGDGAASTAVTGGTDCNDADPNIRPGAAEVCDRVDNNCSGEADEGATDAPTWYRDSDQDGFGDAASTTRACAMPEGYVGNSTDCDDTRSQVYPEAPEACDGLDNDCDLQVDEQVKTTFYQDSDQDEYGNASSTTSACVVPAGYTVDATDCNDLRRDVYPGAPELCDLVDNDCDSRVDEDVQTSFYQDSDQDTYGNPAVSTLACAQPSGYSANNQDCDDARANVYPGAPETCDLLDNNCNQEVDEGVLTVFHRDADQDQYGDAASTTVACSAPVGYVLDDTDCDDTRANVNPGTQEACDGLDNDCDLQVDEGVKTAFYQDSDGDTYGNGGVSVTACQAPTGYVTSSTDCDDGHSDTYPGATERCDGRDNDCDTSIDEGVKSLWYQDNDRDAYGSAVSQEACSAPAGYVGVGGDCDDTRNTVYPGAAELCDTLDNDCDQLIDEGLATATWYPDPDADGLGTSSGAVSSCAQPAGTVSTGGDNCPTTANASQADYDRDGVGDVCDNCASVANPGQEPGSSSTVGAACDTVTSGLLLFLDADNPSSWASRAAPTTSSSAWRDLSGNGNHAVASTTLGYQTGSPGGFMYSRDAADRATVTIGNLPQGNSAFTGEAWFAFHPYASSCVSVLEWGTPFTNNARAGLLICSAANNPYFVGQSNDYSVSSSLRSGTAQHVVFTFDGSNLKVYVNGLQVGATTKTLNVTGKTVYVGVDNTRNSEPFSGTIHSVRVYSKALSASEVTQNFNAEKSRFGYGTASCVAAKNAGKTSSGVYYLQPDTTPPVAAWCDQSMDNGGWTLLLSANGSSTYWGNNASSYKADGTDMPPLGPGNYDYHARAYGSLPTNELRLCYSTTSRCFTFPHSRGISMKSFFVNSISYVMYSQGSYGYSNTGSSSSVTSYLSALGLTAHSVTCTWLGINDVRSISSIGLLGDWNGGCDGSGYPYHDDLAIGVGLQSCYDANSCNNGGSGHAAGQTRGANGVDNSGVYGPWFVFGR